MKMALCFILAAAAGLTFSGCFEEGKKILFAESVTQLDGESGNILKMSEFDFVSCGPRYNCVITTEARNGNPNQVLPFIFMPRLA